MYETEGRIPEEWVSYEFRAILISRGSSRVTLSRKIRQALEELYLELSTQVGFPEKCLEAALLGAERFKLANVHGWFLIDHLPDPPPKHSYLIRPHSWLEDKNHTIADLVAHQFNCGLVQPVKPGLMLVKKDDPFYQRYLRAGEVNHQDYFVK